MVTNSPSVARTILIVVVVAFAAALIVSGAHEFSRERIDFNERQRLLLSLDSVLSPSLDAANLEAVRLEVVDRELLGSENAVDVFVMQRDREPVAVIFASIAPDGYNAEIQLLVGLSPAGRITGVRVVAHRETPGLGDAIEVEKSDWIRQFSGRQLGDPPLENWAVDKDGGVFDSLTGATVTPRAVVAAIKNTLLYFDANKERVFERAVQLSAEGDGDEPR
jgi:electron transport complex protein RnfG